MSYILGCELAFPKPCYGQDELLEALLALWGDQLFNPDRLRAFFQNVQVGKRHLALPKEQYAGLPDFASKNQAYVRVALELWEELLPRTLGGLGLSLDALHTLVSTTVTGLSVPSLEARLMNRVPIPKTVRRLPLFGLGCLGGAAGIARTSELLSGTDKMGALLAVELCSLTLQTKNVSIANLISTGLFGDGAACAVLVGERHPAVCESTEKPRCRVVDARSVVFANSEEVMGWDFDADGFHIVLNSEVPNYARVPVSQALEEFLGEHGLVPKDIGQWIAHPGGPKVIDALEEGLGLPGALQSSRESLARVGNLSSVSVLGLLHQTLGSEPSSEWGVLMAMGPAFCAEFVLLRWES